MTIEQIIGLIVALLLMGVGILGCILPVLPCTPVVFLAALLHKLYFGDTGAAWWLLVILGLLMVGSLIIDYVASVYGARKLGATWRGAVGAIAGGLIGLFFSIPGILIGPFAGAVVFELAGGRTWKESSKAGMGATLGLLAGGIGRLGCCLLMTAAFAVNVVYRSV